MNLTLETAVISAAAALLGAFIGSISPAVVALLNTRAETKRERLRQAVQLALAEHAHLMDRAARERANGTELVIAPIGAMLVYHLQLQDLVSNKRYIGPEDMLALRRNAAEMLEALANEKPLGGSR